MYPYSDLKRLHLEISSNCQAKCPLCPRTIKGSTNPNLPIKSWSISDFKTILPPDVIKQLDYIFFCGNYGDPLMCTDLIDMISYTVDNNPEFGFGIHTNGGLRSKSWWKDLAKALPKSHKVTFALDGLSDTHSLYRVGTDFNTVLENARTFIEAGGQAEWQFIKFRHNQHQVAEAKQMSEDLGFINFWTRDSQRWHRPKFPVYVDNEVTHYLEPTDTSDLLIVTDTLVKNIDNILSQVTISCAAQHRQEAFISFDGTVLPCCFLAQIPHITVHDDAPDAGKEISYKTKTQYWDLVKSLGGAQKLNSLQRSLESIINSEPYQNIWDTYWNEKKMITCAHHCPKHEVAS